MNTTAVEKIKEAFFGLTDEQRVEIMLDYCRDCGCYTGETNCRSCNDE